MKKAEIKRIEIKRIEIKRIGGKSFKFFIFLFSILYSLFSAVYADVSMTASVDKNTVCLGDAVTLQVNVSGNIANIPKPQLPELLDFNVYSSGTSQNVSFVNGAVSTSLSYNFILSPNKIGKFTIGPVKLEVGGQPYTTEPITIEVVSTSSSKPSASVSQRQSHITEDENRGIFVTANVDKKTVYVGDGLTYTFRFFISRNLLSQPQYHSPDFTGFIVEDLPPQKNYQTTINGKRYNVVEIKSKLFPTTSGKYNLGAASLSVNIEDFSSDSFRGFFDDDFFKGFFGGGKTATAKSQSITISVLPLPTEAKSSDFSGAVGVYKMTASVDKTEVEANSPVTLTVEISGNGNIKSIPQPKFSNIVGARVYDTITSFNISKVNYTLSGCKIFKTAIIPENVGNLIIPGLEFSYFDPVQKKYKKEKTLSIEIKVKPSKAFHQVGNQLTAGSVNIVGEDIRFIKLSPGKKSSDKISDTISNTLIVLSVFLIIASFGFIKYTQFTLKNYSMLRSKKAYKRFLSNVNKIKTEEPEKFYAELHSEMIEYLSDKIRTNLNGLTFSEIEIILSRKLSSEDIKKIQNILEEADFFRFTPDGSKEIDIQKETEKVIAIISEVDRGWKYKVYKVYKVRKL
ncbi:MAG: BatD family protein [Elusimicrobiota bacterium]